jgi:mono/diheme cytochrome c family protein
MVLCALTGLACVALGQADEPTIDAPVDRTIHGTARFTGKADRLSFTTASGGERTLTLLDLLGLCPTTDIEVQDPYHEKRMRYRALPLVCVLDQGFANSGGAAGLRNHGLLLRALDGYTRPVSGRVLLTPGAFLAYGEPDRLAANQTGSRFRPIDRRGADPAPFYLVWVGTEQGDPHETPWPYQLGRIEVAPFAAAFPRTVPEGLESTGLGWAGYQLFQDTCASCHSINGQGGKIGPDLNIPRSIVEYRPIPQIRSYVRNPQQTRYTSMPAHPGLSEADLDALIAYFLAMSERKQDPRQAEGT